MTSGTGDRICGRRLTAGPASAQFIVNARKRLKPSPSSRRRLASTNIGPAVPDHRADVSELRNMGGTDRAPPSAHNPSR
jgi:hypothetical protein